jgi:S-(hydroxymethyl)glutathione dehydrogenase / alcohol dehydrogenase
MTMKSKAAVAYEANQPMRIDWVTVEPPAEGEVLVEIKATGLCHSDLHALQGKWSFNSGFPGIMGHEGAGVVLAVGAGVTRVAPGDHVVAFAPECGRCPFCVSGKTNMCAEGFIDALPNSRFILPDGRRAHPFMSLGTFTNYTVIREIHLIKVREDAPFDQLCYLSCGATTGLGAALFTAKVTPGSSVIVFGLGGIGLNVVQGARLSGASTILAVDTNPAKEKMARRMGATAFVNPRELKGDDLVGHLNALTGGGADFTFEAVGNVKLMRLAYEAAHMAWGVCTVIGIAPDNDVVEVPPTSLITGRKLQGCGMGGAHHAEIRKLVDWMMQDKIDLASLITDRMALEDINEGYDMMKRGEGIRTVVTFP